MNQAESNIVLKIHEGTTRGSGSLCRTCRNAHRVRGVNNQEVVYCTAGSGMGGALALTYEVAECNRYFNATQPTLYEMEEIAWRLVTKKAGREIGFVNASEFQRMEDERHSRALPRE